MLNTLCTPPLGLSISVFVTLAGLVSTTELLLGQDEAPAKYELPENGNAVIFAYDLQNGFTPPRQNLAPVLLIRANGRVEMPSLYGEGRDIKGQLSETELQAFLRFLIEENKFVEFDARIVQGKIEQIRARKKVPQIADAPDTVISLQIPGHSHSVRQPAVGMPAEFKEVTALQQLLSIRRAVNRLMSETRVGGKSGIAKLLATVNEKLKIEHPDVAPLSTSDFSGSYVRQDAAICATVSRPGRGADGKPDGTYVTAVTVMPMGSDLPEVKLRVKN